LISKNNTIAGTTPEEPEETPDDSIIVDGCEKNYFIIGMSASSYEDAILNAKRIEATGKSISYSTFDY
jgi:hypothetical protein